MKKCLGKKVILPSDIIKKKLLYNKIYLAGRYIDEQILQLKKLKLYKKIKIFKNYELVEKKKNLIKREKKILEILKILINNLNKYRVSYWLDRSSLLAIYRSQLLSELSDVDISIVKISSECALLISDNLLPSMSHIFIFLSIPALTNLLPYIFIVYMVIMVLYLY